MAKTIFRQAALDRLAAPEGYDRPPRLVRPTGWLALLFLCATILGALYWCARAEAPVKVAASGIILPEGGLQEIVADMDGQIDELYLQPGQIIAQGDPVATFRRVELQRELDEARAEYVDARARLDQLTEFYRSKDERETEAEDERRATIEYTQSLVAERRVLLETRKEAVGNLVKRKIMAQEKLLEADLELAEASERIAVLEDETNTLKLRRIDRQSEQRLALVDEKLKVDQLAREVERLEARVSDNQVIKSAHSGRIIEVRVNRGDVVKPGMALATLSPETEGPARDGTDIVGLLYVSPADGKRVTPGMTAEVEPTTVRREEHGFILAEVISVSAAPATIEGMRSTLKNERLVTQLSGDGAPFEARVRFLTDPATPSGLKWSSSKGPGTPVLSGTLLNGRVIVDHVPIIDFVVPGLSEKIGAPDG
ncbi:MAG: NHLP bacteriocin system secretion protein [Rhodobiaceae bacterium]|nr:NHLP bacteriocin system secretion protein [Rhodobiaceae bacterium]